MNYTDVKNCTCTYCEEACKPTTISDVIGFFDGFNGLLVGIVYAILLIFSIVFTLVKMKYFKPSQNMEEIVERTSTFHANNIN